ncbi:MAG: hypothetical protein E6L09_09875 [Verrucomicrobia bacterium]|nr:MAG: hypothetical protein E6L09_09875 [Verrucomicrobiota bacterium]
MSLKAFHVVFVAASILLAFGFGVWSLLDYRDHGKIAELIGGIVSVLVGFALIVYVKAILRKLKNISYL